MRKLFLCLVVLLLVVPSNEAQSRKAPSLVQLLEVGEFHGDEVKARTSSGWLGLFVSKKTSALRFTSVRINQVFDPIIDSEGKKATGKRVSVPQVSAPIFLIKNAPTLKAETVKSLVTEEIHLTNSRLVKLVLEGRHYQIKVLTNSKEENVLSGNAKLQLSYDGINQTLYSYKMGESPDAGWSIVWAGDLDGDNKLDVYVDVTYHYNISIKKLFLSSQAGKGQLVREVARFEITGC